MRHRSWHSNILLVMSQIQYSLHKHTATLQIYSVLCALSPWSTWTLLSCNTLLHPRMRKWIFYSGPGLNPCCIIHSPHTNVQYTWSFVWNQPTTRTYNCKQHISKQRCYKGRRTLIQWTLHCLFFKKVFSVFLCFFCYQMKTAQPTFFRV